MIVNQWVPAAHRGDAIGDSARRVRDLLRALGHESDIYALTMDEDLVQEVFVQVHKSLRDFRGEARFSTWLHRVTVNVVLMHRRSEKSRQRSATSDQLEYARPTTTAVCCQLSAVGCQLSALCSD